MVWAVVIAVLGLAAAAGTAGADVGQRAFTLMGSETFPSGSGAPRLPRTGSELASDLSRDVRDVMAMPDGRVGVLSASGAIDVIGLDGRLARLARLSAVPEVGDAADAAPDGSLLIISAGRVWRVFDGGLAAPLTPPSSDDQEVVSVAALGDGGFVYALKDYARDSTTVQQVAADGSVRPLAGSRRGGHPIEGPALSSPLPDDLTLHGTPAGDVLFAVHSGLDDGGIWQVTADGMLRRVDRGDERRPRDGSPVSDASFGDVVGVAGDLASELLLLTSRDLWAVRNGAVFRVMAGRAGRTSLWAGARPAAVFDVDARLGPIDRSPDGDVLFATADGVGLLARPRLEAPRLAVAVTSNTLRTIRRRQVAIAATRRAAVEVSAVRGGRTVLRFAATVEPGVTTVDLPARLPAGVVRLVVSAVDDRGAVATHRLSVLGTPTVPIAVARRMLLSVGDDFNTSASVRACRRVDVRRVDCVLIIESDIGTERFRGSVTLRQDGWLWVRIGRHASRVQLF